MRGIRFYRQEKNGIPSGPVIALKTETPITHNGILRYEVMKGDDVAEERPVITSIDEPELRTNYRRISEERARLECPGLFARLDYERAKGIF